MPLLKAPQGSGGVISKSVAINLAEAALSVVADVLGEPDVIGSSAALCPLMAKMCFVKFINGIAQNQSCVLIKKVRIQKGQGRARVCPKGRSSHLISISGNRGSSAEFFMFFSDSSLDPSISLTSSTVMSPVVSNVVSVMFRGESRGLGEKAAMCSHVFPSVTGWFPSHSRGM